MSLNVWTTVQGTEELRTETRNVRTPTETLSCSALVRENGERRPSTSQWPLDARRKRRVQLDAVNST